MLGVAGAAALTALPAQAATSSTTNGIVRVFVSGVTANNTNKTFTVAVGPTTPGQVVPAGSVWTYTVNVWAPWSGEGVNFPTVSTTSLGTWSKPVKAGPMDGTKQAFTFTFTSKVPLSTTSAGPTFQWVNSSRPLRPGSDIQVISVAPDGSTNDQFFFGNQKAGTYNY